LLVAAVVVVGEVEAVLVEFYLAQL